ncbi:MAG TPA: cytochrome P450 [Solirubrobacteraceae bacterium]|nr:cytochrome P450 [Solirubrobacteraceae bacterium]
MSVTIEKSAPGAAEGATPASGETMPSQPRYAASPCHPVEENTPVRLPPGTSTSKLAQTLRFLRDPFNSALTDQATLGSPWTMRLLANRDDFLATSHPDHIRAIFTAAKDAPAINHESPLRLLLGKNSVLTLSGPRHMQQRKLLLPPFHGDAIANYMGMIEEVTAREIDTWTPGTEFALAPRMQAVTLEVIMRGVLGIHELGGWNTPERRFREVVRTFLQMSTTRLYPFVEMTNFRSESATGPIKWMMDLTDREIYALIRKRRAEGEDTGRNDVFSLLLAARDEEGRPMSDVELRDELMTLILAGHETTANSLAWTFERLIRNPGAYERLRETVRGEDDELSRHMIEATVHEGMRQRPVIAFVVRRVRRPWRFGEFVVPANTPVALSIIGVHHRPDVYADPFVFAPERFLDAGGVFQKPGTYEWIPFGGGIRRCLGATLAMAEQRVVLGAIARRVDFAVTDAPGERARQRNVTSIPADGGRVRVLRRD